jgi:hypothetical protein
LILDVLHIPNIMQSLINRELVDVPALIESSANIPQAIADIFLSTTLEPDKVVSDNVPTADQAIVCDRAIQATVMAECARQGGCFLTPKEQEQLDAVMWVAGDLNPLLIGQSAIDVARQAGFSVPASTRVLLVPATVDGPDVPLAATQPFPVLAFYSVTVPFKRPLRQSASI